MGYYANQPVAVHGQQPCPQVKGSEPIIHTKSGHLRYQRLERVQSFLLGLEDFSRLTVFPVWLPRDRDVLESNSVTSSQSIIST